MTSVLDVEVDGRRTSYEPESTPVVRFGRGRDVEMPVAAPDGRADLHMSRHVGSFRHRDGTWTLDNPAPSEPGKTRAVLEVVTLNGSTSAVPPGASVPLPGVGEIRWQTTSTSAYAIRYRFAGVTAASVRSADPTTGQPTSQVELTPREVDFCVVLAEPELFGSLRAHRPSLPEVAEVWHVSLGTVEKTLRSLRQKLTAAGMVDFDDDQKVRDKSARLAGAVVEFGIIGMDDWRHAHRGDSEALVPSAEGPRFAHEATP